MSGFYGTEQQRALQRRTQMMRDRIADAHGIYDAGRFMGIDEPEKVPPSEVERMLARDGLVAFRMISPAQAASVFPPLEARGYRIDTWDIFVGGLDDAGARAQAIACRPLPDGLAVGPLHDDPEGAETLALQRFLAASGLAPFPGGRLLALPPRAKTIVVREGDQIAATGHAYFPHNAHSRFRDHAWVGLIAVDERWRGKGLGRLINALLVRAAFEELGAARVYEMVAPSNASSRRMVEACGLALDPALRCGVAMPGSAARFTR